MGNELCFDKRKEYEEMISDHVNEIEKICHELHVPFFFCSCVSVTKNENGAFEAAYKRAGRTPADFNLRIPVNDEVSRHYSVSLGARVINGVTADVGHVADCQNDEDSFELI